MSGEGSREPSNPFATRYVRPGALAYRLAAETSLEDLVGRLAAAGWRGQIVGPHGSGKSTLLAALGPRLEAAGRRVVRIELHDGQRRLPQDALREAAGGDTLVIVDGYEQLGWWSRRALAWWVRRQRAGLLVTAHRAVRLPIVHRTQTSVELAQQLVAALVAGDEQAITAADVERCYDEQQGDLREVFFALYDLYERRRRHNR